MELALQLGVLSLDGVDLRRQGLQASLDALLPSQVVGEDRGIGAGADDAFDSVVAASDVSGALREEEEGVLGERWSWLSSSDSPSARLLRRPITLSSASEWMAKPELTLSFCLRQWRHALVLFALVRL